jgi:hypothetical protein
MTTAGAGRPVAAAAVLTVAAGLTGCANDQQRTRTEGAGIGAVLGAVVGHALGGRDGAIAAPAIGGVAGGVAG